MGVVGGAPVGFMVVVISGFSVEIVVVGLMVGVVGGVVLVVIGVVITVVVDISVGLMVVVGDSVAALVLLFEAGSENKNNYYILYKQVQYK